MFDRIFNQLERLKIYQLLETVFFRKTFVLSILMFEHELGKISNDNYINRTVFFDWQVGKCSMLSWSKTLTEDKKSNRIVDKF